MPRRQRARPSADLDKWLTSYLLAADRSRRLGAGKAPPPLAYLDGVDRAAIRRGIDKGLAALGERSARRLSPYFPYSIRLDHPPTAEPRPRYGYGRPSHPGIEKLLAASTDRYATYLQSFTEYFEELSGFALRAEDSPEPSWIHPWLIGWDTVSLYGFTRRRRPARYVEIGSGQSTKIVARARRDGTTETEITSIDPRPRSEIDGLCDRVIRRPLEQIDLAEVFGPVQEGDVVFLDGSHRVFPNSDCVVFFLDVLPNLPPGVLVGIHDVFLPEDYPQVFLEMWWSEQYLLAAVLLAAGSGLEVALPTFYASGNAELASILDPLFDRPHLREVNRRGSLFWMETTPDPAGAR